MAIKIEKNSLAVTFNEVKGNNLKNYEMYTEGIKALGEIGRIATLKIVEAVARVNIKSLWKLGTSEKTNLPYNSINEWAIEEFSFSKSHVSEILTVAKNCCDPETGTPLPELAGYGYTQLLAFTKNPELLARVKAGEEIEGLSLSLSAKDIKSFAIEDKSNKENKSKGNEDDKSKGNEDDKSNGNDKEKVSAPHEERTIVFKMADIERWYNILQDIHSDVEAIITDKNIPETSKICLDLDAISIEWEKALGL